MPFPCCCTLCIFIFCDKMNRRRAAAALLLMRQLSYGHQYWVHPINTKREECGEYYALYKDLTNYPDQFYTYYCMTTQSFWLHIDANSRSHIQTKTKLLTKYLPRRKVRCLYQVPCYRWFHYHHCLQHKVRNINCLEHHTWCLLCYLGCYITHTHAFTYWRRMEIYWWSFLQKVEYTKLLGCNWWQTCKYSSPSKFWITVLQL